MTILVTGATGFTGSYAVPLLLERFGRIRCFVRNPNNSGLLKSADVELAPGDLTDAASLAHAMDGVDTLVNLASLGFGHAPAIVETAVRFGVKRAVFISTTAIFTTLKADSKLVRVQAEEVIRRSGLAYTILRPTMIYGSPRDRNICRLIRYLRRWPVIPIFGNGKCLQQPVYVGDVAMAVVQCLGEEKTAGKAYDISGSAPLSYDELIDTVCRAMGRRVAKLHFSSGAVVSLLGVLERCSLPLPIRSEQIQRLNENKCFDHSAATKDFGYRPLSFEQGIRLQLNQMDV